MAIVVCLGEVISVWINLRLVMWSLDLEVVLG